MVGTVARTAQRPTPDRTRIMRMATIRYLAGSDAADYGDRLFALSDEQLQGIHDRLLLNMSKAADLPPAVRATSPSHNKPSPVQSHPYTQEGYMAWRSTDEGIERYGEAEESSKAARARDAERWGMKRIFEDQRWHGEAGWNNNWTAPMGRELCRNHPEWPADFFETRTSKADNWTFGQPE
jgi:hypothetical protein